MSRVIGLRPDLFTAYLHVSSEWNGEIEKVTKEQVPIYFAIGRNDEYYGLEPTLNAYNSFYSAYRALGLDSTEIDGLLVLDIKEHEYFLERNMTSEHGGGGLFAYDERIMEWLFSQVKEV